MENPVAVAQTVGLTGDGRVAKKGCNEAALWDEYWDDFAVGETASKMANAMAVERETSKAGDSAAEKVV